MSAISSLVAAVAFPRAAYRRKHVRPSARSRDVSIVNVALPSIKHDLHFS